MPTEPRRQLRLAAIVLAVVMAALLAVYFTFFRVPMIPAFQNVRQADASAIVAQLDKAGITYSLANDGHDVMVPQDRAADARVAVAGANVALGGTIGFELFNDSDMGLTEFAQKINFQRAMQGELARTIMAMQGVEFARVHLALPERSIFRASQGTPTSAVTIQMAPGHTLTRQRIDGVRQLIASSVPGLSQAAVAVLDENGDLVSPAISADNSFGAPLDEGSALDNYYQLRAKEAIARAVPDLTYDVIVNVRRDIAGAAEQPGEDRDMPGRTRSAMTVLVRTEAPLAAEVQSRVEAALTDSLTLRRDAGDTLRFVVGAIRAHTAAPVATPLPRDSSAVPMAATPDEASIGSSINWGILGGLALLGLTGFLLLRPRRRLDDAEAESFADALKTHANERVATDAG